MQKEIEVLITHNFFVCENCAMPIEVDSLQIHTIIYCPNCEATYKILEIKELLVRLQETFED